jgi:hypothetical protein
MHCTPDGRSARQVNKQHYCGRLHSKQNRHINIELSVQQPEQQTTIKTEYKFQSEFG